MWRFQMVEIRGDGSDVRINVLHWWLHSSWIPAEPRWTPPKSGPLSGCSLRWYPGWCRTGGFPLSKSRAKDVIFYSFPLQTAAKHSLISKINIAGDQYTVSTMSGDHLSEPHLRLHAPPPPSGTGAQIQTNSLKPARSWELEVANISLRLVLLWWTKTWGWPTTNELQLVAASAWSWHSLDTQHHLWHCRLLPACPCFSLVQWEGK